MVERARRRQMQLSTRSCLCSIHNCKSLQREAWTTARWTLEASLTSSWSDIVEQGHAEALVMIHRTSVRSCATLRDFSLQKSRR